MESSRKRKAAPATPSSAAPEGSASKKLKLLNSKHATAAKSNVLELGQKLLQQLHRGTDKTGRSIVTQFLTLPSRAALPDYYTFTKLPLALDTIEAKLAQNAYPTMTTLESDFKRMVQNAKDYNAPKSDVYEDAERIRKLVYNYMKVNNPQYGEDPNYTSFPTPIEGVNGGPVQGSGQEVEEVGGEGEGRAVSEKAKRMLAPKASEAPSDRKESVAPSAATGDFDGAEDDEEGGGEGNADIDFTGKTFQEAQQLIVSHLLHYTDTEGLEIYTPFGNLPSRKLEDYYKLIRHPVSLKSLAKRCRGQHGRAAPTGATDFKTWDAFEEEVSFIWRNAQDYNEDGSAMFTLADEFKEHFRTLLAEAKSHVEEPAGPRIKLGGPKPKVTLNLSQNRINSPTPGVSVDNDALLRQRQLVAAGAANGHQHRPPLLNGGVRSSSHIEPRPSSNGIPGAVKYEKQSPALNTLQPMSNGHAMLPPAARGGPFPPPPPTSSTGAGAGAAVPGFSSYTYTPPTLLPPTPIRPYALEASLLPALTIATHPYLTTALPAKTPWSLTIPPHSILSVQSTTITLPATHYFLQISPTISKELSIGRPYKLFVSLNGIRMTQRDTVFDATTGRRTHVYEGTLMTGVNRVDVEVVAQKVGEGERGEGLDMEKMGVFVHMMRPVV